MSTKEVRSELAPTQGMRDTVIQARTAAFETDVDGYMSHVRLYPEHIESLALQVRSISRFTKTGKKMHKVISQAVLPLAIAIELRDALTTWIDYQQRLAELAEEREEG